jgi:hypothetical protein
MGISARSRKGMLFFIAAISLVAILLIPATAAFAAGSSLTTSPVTLNLNVQPGHSETSTLQVQNNGTKAISVGVVVRSFKAQGTSGQAAIEAPSSSDPSLSWVHFSQSTFTAQPGVWTSIKMTITLPPTANLGYYYAILFKPILPVNTTTDTNTVTLSNAILALVDTGSSNEVRQLQVSSFTSSKKLYEYLPATFSIEVHNSGNIFVPPQGELYISKSSSFHSILATLDINKSAGHVLPDSSRIFTAQWSDGFPQYDPVLIAGQPVFKKNGQPVEKLNWNFANVSKLRFGKYYARLALVYNNGQRDIPIYATVSFWVIPWKLLSIVLIILLLPIILIVIAFRYRRMYKKSRKPKHEDS